MDPTTAITEFLNTLLPLVPSQYAAAIAVYGALIQAILSAVIFSWSKTPPKTGTKARTVYNVLSALALYSRHAPKADETSSSGVKS